MCVLTDLCLLATSQWSVSFLAIFWNEITLIWLPASSGGSQWFYQRPMVIAPTIGWRFPATEHPQPIWDWIRIQLLQMKLTGESNEPWQSWLVKNAELTPPLQKKSQPVARCLGVGNAFWLLRLRRGVSWHSASNGHWRNHWMEDSKLHRQHLPGYWLSAVLMWRCWWPYVTWQGIGGWTPLALDISGCWSRSWCSVLSWRQSTHRNGLVRWCDGPMSCSYPWWLLSLAKWWF